MSHPLRKWLKDLLQYGRRGVRTPADGKPPLLWAADLPRLGRMWLGHYWFRMWLDLRSTPPRVTYDPREVFSPHVRMIRPTTLNPIRPLRRMREALASLRLWLAAGGPGRVAAKLGRGLAGGAAGAFGAAVLGLFGVVGALLTGLVGLFGASAIGTALGASALGRGTRKAAGAARSGLARLGEGVAAGSAGLAGRFRSPREAAWTFATVTGAGGLILLIVIQANGLPGRPKQAQAADTHVARRPPAQLALAEPAEDPFGGLPDPFGPAPEPVPEQAEPAAAELEVDVARAELPPDVARFNLPDDAEEFLVESAAPTPDLAALPNDDWLLSTPRHEIDRPPVVPAAYRETADAPPDAPALPEPAETADRFAAARREVGVTVRKSQPEGAKAGELFWYDLVVTNHGDEPVGGLIVEERVAEPHRVADARPAAAFDDGVLTWRLDGLGPREERRLSVAVYPMSADPVATAAAVRPVATFSAVTLVQAGQPYVEEPFTDEPLIEEPPADPPGPIAEPEPAAEPLRRVRLAMTTPERVANGAGCVIRFAVTNTGAAPLTGVVVRGVLPDGLRHPHGPDVESDLGGLGPGETKTAELRVTARTVGEAELIAEVRAAEGVATTVRGSLAVVEPARPNADPPCCCYPVGLAR